MAEYIEREATKKEFNIHFGDVHDAVIANRLIDSIQAADVAPVRHGKWIGKEGLYQGTCIVCGYRTYDKTADWARKHFHYCPNCGARMNDA